MNRYYIWGSHQNGKHGILCIMEGECAEDALNKARRYYGILYVDGVQRVDDLTERVYGERVGK